MKKTAALIDLSITFRRHWHATEHEEVGEALTRTVADVHRFASRHDGAALCLDSPPYRRSKIDASYKAQREQASGMMIGQMDAVNERLEKDGFLLLRADGYEADDIIATATEALVRQDHKVVIYSGDKDLLQLVGDNVVCVSNAAGQRPETGDARERRFDAKGVYEKFGVEPSQMCDALALVGDKSDNIPGIAKIGFKTAAKLIDQYGDLEGVLEAACLGKIRTFSERIAAASEQLAQSVQLIALETDAPIDVSTLFNPRVERPLLQEEIDFGAPSEADRASEAAQPTQACIIDASGPSVGSNATNVPSAAQSSTVANPHGEIIPRNIGPSTAPQSPEPRQIVVSRPVTPEWRQALEPVSIKEAITLAGHLYNSRMFPQFKSAQAVLAVIMTGRSMGLDAVTSLRGFDVIQGKVGPKAVLLLGQVKNSPLCEHFSLLESTATAAKWSTRHVKDPAPAVLEFTIAEAEQRGLMGNDNWRKMPKTMLRWRCGVELARAVYPEIVSGLYTSDEIEDMDLAPNLEVVA
jgi:5'-3' exonuclease